MEEYTFLRQLADSWFLLAMFAFFVAVIFWVFRPGSTKQYRDTANIPFRNSDAPAPQTEDAKSTTAKEAGK